MWNRTAVAVVALLALTSVAALAQGIPPGAWEATPPETQLVPSWFGSTGLIAVPSARVLPDHQIQAAAHRIENDVKTQYLFSANVGVIENLEFGATHLRGFPQRGAVGGLNDETIFNAKYRLDLARWTNLDPTQAPEVAVGVLDASDELNRVWYVVLTKDFMPELGPERGVTAHLGWGRSRSDGGVLDGVFAGLEFIPAARTLLQVEYDANDLNACARYFVTDTIAIDAGVVDSDFAWGVTLATPF